MQNLIYGLLKNENAMGTALVSKEQVQESELEQLVERTFEGSIPSFIAAFSRSKRLTDEEVAQLQELIDNYKR